MKHLYKSFLFLIAALWVTTSSAQFHFEPHMNYKSDFEFTDFETVAYGTLINTSGEALSITWERTEISLPEEWQSLICDLNICYMPHVSTQSFTIMPDETSPMDVHIRPNGVEGTALIKLEAWLTESPDMHVDSAFYFFDQALAVPERLEGALKIFPNPVDEKFFVEGGEKVVLLEIHDINGRLVKSVQGDLTSGVSIADFQSGHYIVRMYDDQKRRISGNILVKR